MKIQKGRVILFFDYAGTGLVFKESNGVSNFLVAGKDSMFVKANVEVDGKSLIVYSDGVKVRSRSGTPGRTKQWRRCSIRKGYRPRHSERIIGIRSGSRKGNRRDFSAWVRLYKCKNILENQY